MNAKSCRVIRFRVSFGVVFLLVVRARSAFGRGGRGGPSEQGFHFVGLTRHCFKQEASASPRTAQSLQIRLTVLIKQHLGPCRVGCRDEGLIDVEHEDM